MGSLREAIDRVKHYLEMREKRPVMGSGALVDHIHTDTPHEADVSVADLHALVSHAESTVDGAVNDGPKGVDVVSPSIDPITDEHTKIAMLEQESGVSDMNAQGDKARVLKQASAHQLMGPSDDPGSANNPDASAGRVDVASPVSGVDIAKDSEIRGDTPPLVQGAANAKPDVQAVEADKNAKPVASPQSNEAPVTLANAPLGGPQSPRRK